MAFFLKIEIIVVIVVLSTLLYSCRTLTTSILPVYHPIDFPNHAVHPSVAVSIDELQTMQVEAILGNITSDDGVAVLRMCVANYADFPIQFQFRNVYNYLDPEVACNKTRQDELVGIAGGTAIAALSPILLAIIDTNSSRTEKYLSAEAFVISGIMGGLYAVTDIISVMRYNHAYCQHLYEQSLARYTISGKKENCMLLFFDDSNLIGLPELSGQGYSLADSVGAALYNSKHPSLLFESIGHGKSTIFPLTVR